MKGDCGVVFCGSCICIVSVVLRVVRNVRAVNVKVRASA